VAGFAFSETATAEENIEAFLSHLECLDAEMAALLRANVSELLPLPTDNAKKNRARARFNSEVSKALESEEPGDSGEVP